MMRDSIFLAALLTAAAYLAAMICGCVALSRLLAWITSPAAVQAIEEIAMEVARHG